MSDSIYPVPKFFRLLIIDDEIARNPEDMEFFCNIFTAIALEQAREKSFRLEEIEIVFEGDPANGFKRWQDEPFDITLIDIDFSSNLDGKSEKDVDDLVRYVMNSENQGLQIYNLMKGQTTSDGTFDHRHQHICPFFIWTGVSDEVKKGEKKSKLATLLEAAGIPKEEVLKKDNDSLKKLKNIISKQIKKIHSQYNLITKSLIERLLFALKKNYDNIQDRLFGGCLIYDDAEKFNFLRGLGKVKIKEKEESSGEQKEISIRVCPGRIPPVLLDKSNETRFLPLHRKIYDGSLRQAIRYLVNRSTPGVIENYCEKLKKREDRTSSEDADYLPFYPSTRNATGHNHKILGFPVKNEFIAAATPLTGVSVIGEARAREALRRKIEALLQGPFGAVVLKTTYLDDPRQWENIAWPGLQIQSHMRTRCLFPNTGTPTLWNTGCTAVEMLPPKRLNKFLLDISKDGWLKNKTHHIIISMGSKFPQTKSLIRLTKYELVTKYELKKQLKKIWTDFFETIFKKPSEESSFMEKRFPIIEINVRHYLREIIEYYLGGDEYLNPLGFEQKDKPDIDGFWNEFKTWLWIIHDLAVKYKKQLILKFPHRSDVLSYVRWAVMFRELHLAKCEKEERDYGIRGFTLVNALKSPVPNVGIKEEYNIPFTPDWYSNPDAWNDAQDKKFKYQMSGRFIGPYRNQILAGISSELNRIKSLDLEIFVSGGITSKRDIEFIQAMSEQYDNVISGIQIGTWGLLNTELGNKKKTWKDVSEPPKPARLESIRYRPSTERCVGCPKNCEVSCPYNALSRDDQNQLFLIDEKLCDACTTYDCDGKCALGKVKLKPVLRNLEGMKDLERSGSPGTNAISPRISFLNEKLCKACGTCSHTFYCDSFIDRVNDNLPPLTDSRNCSGCGLCVQVCGTGALQLYRPEEMLVLISGSEERKDILRKIGIPFVAYHPEKDIENFAIFQKDTENCAILSKEFMEKMTDPKQGETFLKEFWKTRSKKDKFLPGSQYRDMREKRKEQCIELGKELLKQLGEEKFEVKKAVLKYSLLWSQLIWSDPGQIFWDSFVMAIKTYVKENDGTILENCEIDKLKNKEIKIVNYVVLLREGKIIVNKEIESKEIKISELKNDKLENYKEAFFHKGRRCGLDIRACSDFLVKDTTKLDYSELLTCAGMPWPKLAEEVRKASDKDKETREAFDRLQNAVKVRMYN